MAKVELIMPKMGESIMEATILKWLKSVGDTVELDEPILEIATDKVDSEIPSPVAGVLSEILFKENDVVEIGKVIAVLATEGESSEPVASPAVAESNGVPKEEPIPASSNGTSSPPPVQKPVPAPVVAVAAQDLKPSSTKRFYSPLVRTIAKKEQIGLHELEGVSGSGAKGRVTKKDILAYISTRSAGAQTAPVLQSVVVESSPETSAAATSASPPSDASSLAAKYGAGVEIIEMGRMRKLIADHMVMSKHTSPHVTSFVEADVTNLVEWRNRVKGEFQKKYNEKITFTPLFMEAVTKGLRDFPMVNVSIDGNHIIKKTDLNIGMAAALPSGNLIVPVIKNADHLNLLGLTKKVNDLASRARANKLKPEEIQGGTFTLTNVGTFGNVMGTPIINQPQVAIMAVGAIRKKPAVLETPEGDVIAIRHMMFLSLSYDHRVVDGFLGGSFLRRVGDYLEQFDVSRTI